MLSILWETYLRNPNGERFICRNKINWRGRRRSGGVRSIVGNSFGLNWPLKSISCSDSIMSTESASVSNQACILPRSVCFRYKKDTKTTHWWKKERKKGSLVGDCCLVILAASELKIMSVKFGGNLHYKWMQQPGNSKPTTKRQENKKKW